jgi:polyhydroxybutyrate depolymerase
MVERINVDGTERRYIVHDFSDGKETALVLVLHGGGGSGDNAMSQTGFDRVAEREGLIAVYPYGSGGLNPNQNLLLTWNAGHCCAYAMREQVDDVAFISALIDELVATRSVDPGRVYVTGLSNGGMMSHRLGRELPDKIAAIAPVIASLFGDEEKMPSAMPVLIVNGAADTIVRPEGGPLGLERRLGRRAAETAADAPTLPVTSQAEYWSDVNDCASRAESETTVYSLWTYTDCRDGADVQHYVIKGSGHAWPGGTAPRAQADQPVDTIDINELIWAFFSQH